MNIHIPALIAACLLVVICATFTVTGLQSRDFIPTAAVSETEEEKKEFLYSELVPSNSLKENKIERNVILSVAAFSETYLSR